MTRTTTSQILMIAVLTAAGGWGLQRLLLRQGIHMPHANLATVIALIVAAGLITWGGLVVRAYLNGKRPKLNGLSAARIAVLAKASSITGAVFFGWFAAYVLIALENVGIESQASKALWGGITAGAAVILTVCAMIAERNCQIPPEEPKKETSNAQPA